MKTSNKLLLIFFLSAAGIFCAVHLALYARYSNGNISAENPDELLMIDHEGSLPAVLYLKGNLNVRVVPSDTFYVQWVKADEEEIRHQRSGDSLLIIGDTNIMRDPHSQWQQYGYCPWVTVHCGQLKKMQLSGVLAMVEGGLSPGKMALALVITNTQLLLGKPDDQRPGIHKLSLGQQKGPSQEFYDAVVIHSVNSNVVLNSNTVIRRLDIQLDDRSELHDLYAQIDSPEIRYSNHSQITLSGVNFRKLK